MKSNLVGGRYRPSSTMANLFKALLDGKFHSVGSLKGCAVEKGINMSNRVSRFAAHGKASKRWTLERNGDKVRMIKGKNFSSATPSAKSTDRSEKKAEKKAGKKAGKGATKKRGVRVNEAPSPEE